MSTGSGTQMTEREAEQVERANSSGRSPVAFIHGLWLLPSSWDRWVELFDEAGYAAITPGWPDDPATVEEARAHPEVFAHKGVGQIADYLDGIIRRLSERPAVIGHSFGGLLTEIIGVAGSLPSRSRSAPRPSGVWPLPFSALRSSLPVLSNPANRSGPSRPPHTSARKHNQGVTEIEKLPHAGHALTIDSGWRGVADTALEFVRRFT